MTDATPEFPEAGALELGFFSVSLSVRDLDASRTFYEALGFEVTGGDAEQGWLILVNGRAMIGLFHGMFEGNMLTFNPPDVRAIQRHLAAQGIDAELLHEMQDTLDPVEAQPATTDEGPAHLSLQDPDGNAILIDQF